MSWRMLKVHVRALIWKIENKIKYGEDIFPDTKEYNKVDNIDDIINKLG